MSEAITFTSRMIRLAQVHLISGAPPFLVDQRCGWREGTTNHIIEFMQRGDPGWPQRPTPEPEPTVEEKVVNMAGGVVESELQKADYPPHSLEAYFMAHCQHFDALGQTLQLLSQAIVDQPTAEELTERFEEALAERPADTSAHVVLVNQLLDEFYIVRKKPIQYGTSEDTSTEK